MGLKDYLIGFGAGWLAAMLSIATNRALQRCRQRATAVRHWRAILHDSHVDRMR
jgi:hypothetical protein